MHQQHHDLTAQFFFQPLHMGHGVHIGEELIGVHDVGIVNTTDGVGDDDRGFAVPGGQLLVFSNGNELILLGLPEPLPVNFSGHIPGTGEELHHHGEGHFVGLTEVHAAEMPELQQNTAAFFVEVDALQVIVLVVGSKVQAGLLAHKGHELGFHNGGVHAHDTLAGVLRFQIAEAGFPDVQILHDTAFVKAPENLRNTALALQVVGDDDLGKIDPFRCGIFGGSNLNLPLDLRIHDSGNGNRYTVGRIGGGEALLIRSTVMQRQICGGQDFLAAVQIPKGKPENGHFFRHILPTGILQRGNNTGLLVKLKQIVFCLETKHGNTSQNLV